MPTHTPIMTHATPKAPTWPPRTPPIVYGASYYAYTYIVTNVYPPLSGHSSVLHRSSRRYDEKRALYHIDFDELQINFDFNDKHRETLTGAKLPVLLNLCQCLAKSGGGRGENAGRAAEHAGQAIELDATVRSTSWCRFCHSSSCMHQVEYCVEHTDVEAYPSHVCTRRRCLGVESIDSVRLEKVRHKYLHGKYVHTTSNLQAVMSCVGCCRTVPTCWTALTVETYSSAHLNPPKQRRRSVQRRGSGEERPEWTPEISTGAPLICKR